MIPTGLCFHYSGYTGRVQTTCQGGAHRYAYLGLAGQSINAALVQEKKLADNTLGVYVAEVNAEGPAGPAGLQADDIITGIDNQLTHR